MVLDGSDEEEVTAEPAACPTSLVSEKVQVTNIDMHLAHVQRRVVLDDSDEEEATAEPAARATPLVSDSPVPETPVVPPPQQAIDLAGEQPSPVAIELSDEGGNGQKPEPTSRPRRLS